MSLRHTPWIRFLLAAWVGVLWAVAFPMPGLAGFAWLVPGLLMAVTFTVPRGMAFRAGYVAGVTHYFISLSWLRHIPFPVGAYSAWVALSLFLALFVPLWVLACRRGGERLGLVPREAGGWRDACHRLSEAPWWRLQLWLVLCGSVWVAWEMVLARLFGGFPWNLLGASQYRMIPLIQIASVTGVYGVSFFIVWFSLSLSVAVAILVHRPDHPHRWRRPLVFPGLMLVAVTGGGFWRVLTESPAPRAMTVALVQPSIPQTVIFDPAAATNRFATLLELTEQALATRPDLLLWPEASLPGGLSDENYGALLGRVRDAGAWMIFGADDIEAATTADGREEVRAFNSAFLVNPSGEVVAGYRKRRLVMFGEYIPFVRWFPFLRELAPIGDGFTPGTQPTPFPLGNLKATVSVLICFEDNFPQQAREHCARGIDVLINLTNNAWFGESAAQWQHAANAVFRAIENGVPLIRCSNNGLSGWIDPLGRIHSARIARGDDIYSEGFENAVVRFGSDQRTFYNRVGDLFGWLCVAATLAGLRPSFPIRNRPRPGRGAQTPAPRIRVTT